MNIFLFSVVSSCVFFSLLALSLFIRFIFYYYSLIFFCWILFYFIFCCRCCWLLLSFGPCYNYRILIFNASFFPLLSSYILAPRFMFESFSTEHVCLCALFIIISAARLLSCFARNLTIFVIVIYVRYKKNEMKKKIISTQYEKEKNEMKTDQGKIMIKRNNNETKSLSN